MRVVLGILAAAALVSCGSGTPCTQCPNVAGYYVGTLTPQSADRSTCQTVYFSGGPASVSVTQQDSAISLSSGNSVLDGTGTLYDDDTATFKSAKVPVVDEWGGVIVMADRVMNASFGGAEGARTMSVTLTFNAMIDGESCRLSVNGSLLQKSAH